MQNSKRTILIFIFIIIVLIIIAVALISGENKTNRVIDLYGKIIQSSKYTWQMEEMNSEFDYKMRVSQRDNDINIDTESGGEKSSTLILDGKVYVIMHNLQEYYSVDSSDVDGDIIVPGLKEIIQKEYENGREEVNGKTYYYEEYKNVSNFLMLVHETEDSQIITRFYFDNNDLVYIKNIVKDDDEEQEELLKTKIEFDSSDELFEIPNDYAEM